MVFTSLTIKAMLKMKEEVTKIFDDLDAWRDHCRFNGLVFNESDLYKSAAWKAFAESKSQNSRSTKSKTNKPKKEKK